jgi:NDP-sugar pyrophosphorylase family protein
MRAVILAGGLGTRLRPYTTIIPKPLVPIGDRPVLEHIIRSLIKCGVDRIDLCVGHLGQLICVYLAHADLPRDGRLSFHWESEPLGTAGALAGVPDLHGTFIVMNGDILTTLDYTTLVQYHLEREAALTLAMHAHSVNVDLGVIESDAGLVRSYTEKPTLAFRASMGVYVFDERALAFLPDGQSQLPDLVLRLLDAGERVGAYESDADWYDIGTVGEYERAAADVERFPEKYGLEPLALPPRDVFPAMQAQNGAGRKYAGASGRRA